MIANVQHWTELISKKLSGNIREDEDRMLSAWIERDPEHHDYFVEMSALWAATGTFTTSEVPEADWEGLQKELSGHGHGLPMPGSPGVALSRTLVRRIAAAAAVILAGVMTITLVLREREVAPVVAQAIGEAMREIHLPDGSVVQLREGSTLTYGAEFSERAVTLVGEAFFDVTRDELRPFTVTAGNGTVRVLGTRFNVRTQGDAHVELFVEHGQVAFEPNTQKYEAKIFSAGQAGVIDASNGGDVERVAPPGPNVSSWITGHLVFDHETLNHVIRDLNRHFGISMAVADSLLYACELKADFDHATLDDVLETLAFSLNLQIDTTNHTYLISGQPCQIQEAE